MVHDARSLREILVHLCLIFSLDFCEIGTSNIFWQSAYKKSILLKLMPISTSWIDFAQIDAYVFEFDVRCTYECVFQLSDLSLF